MATCSALTAQETETNLNAEAKAVVDTVVEAQESVSDEVVVDQAAVPEPVAEAVPFASDVVYDAGVVPGGVVTGGVVTAGGCCGQPVQSYSPCNSCCGQTSFVQPVVFNQPVVSSQPVFAENFSSQAIPEVPVSVVNAVPAAATFAPQPVAGCSSCGGASVNYAPAPVVAAPVASQSFVSTPVQSAGCSSCNAQTAAPSACETCKPSRRSRLQRGIFTRLRNAAIINAIDD